MNSIEQVRNSNDEISLYDIWDVLVQRKAVILGICLSAIAVAVIYAFTLTPVYLVAAKIQVGKIGYNSDRETLSTIRLEPPQVVASRLSEELGDGFKVSIENDNVRVVSEGAQTEQLVGKLESAINSLIIKHKDLYKQTYKLVDGSSKAIDEQLADISTQSKQIDTLNKTVKSSDNKITLLTEGQNLLDRKIILQKKMVLSKLAILDSKPTLILEKPHVVANPIKSKIIRIFILAITMGLFFGIVTAFMLEFVKNAQARRLKN